MFFDILLFPFPESASDEPNPTFSYNKYIHNGQSKQEFFCEGHESKPFQNDN